MALIVHKYGGTSVGSVERIRNVARRLEKWHRAGHQLVVVVSAMSGETNRLIALAKEIQASPDPRELDVIASTGEQVTIGLLSMALMDRGLFVTELMGQGVNGVTGDYSRGAAGFWVEGGRLVHPVHEVTVAGNLRDIYKGIVDVGADVDLRGGIRTGSVLVERMTVAGA